MGNMVLRDHPQSVEERVPRFRGWALVAGVLRRPKDKSKGRAKAGGFVRELVAGFEL